MPSSDFKPSLTSFEEFLNFIRLHRSSREGYPAHLLPLPVDGTNPDLRFCIVEVDGKLVRSCETEVTAEMEVIIESKRAKGARSEAFDVILGNHMLYCTVCDNNENCRSITPR
jgi:hypothetical protein